MVISFHRVRGVLLPASLIAVTVMTPAGIVGGMTHMVYHAFTKITMFCCAGAIIVKSGREYVYELEGFGRAMPVVFATFTVSSFALIGMPPLGGFAGKWMIAEAAVASVAAVLALTFWRSGALGLTLRSCLA